MDNFFDMLCFRRLCRGVARPGPVTSPALPAARVANARAAPGAVEAREVRGTHATPGLSSTASSGVLRLRFRSS